MRGCPDIGPCGGEQRGRDQPERRGRGQSMAKDRLSYSDGRLDTRRSYSYMDVSLSYYHIQCNPREREGVREMKR